MNAGIDIERAGQIVIVRVPMLVKKRGGHKQIIVPENLPLDATPTAAPQEPLVTALARAHYWQQLIESGCYSSIAALAEALGVDRRYVGRILGLTCLAPVIVEAIVEGREPSGLSLERLVKGVPMAWEEQRIALEFEADSIVPSGRWGKTKTEITRVPPDRDPAGMRNT